MLTLEQVQITLGAFALSADLSINPGARVSIVGPSGAGKSTLLSAISGFTQPQRGRILWSGTDITGLHVSQRPLSVLFQDNNLFPHLTAEQNLALGLKPSLRLSSAERHRVLATLGSVGLEGFGARRPAQLSGGQQSRVALARVLLRAQPLLLLDEPFAALGPGLRAEMLDLVMQIADEAGQTLLMVTHDIKDAERLDGQTIYVDAGRANPPVATAELLASPPEALRAYLYK
jgi:thiamine transport system ATP-binding protein